MYLAMASLTHAHERTRYSGGIYGESSIAGRNSNCNACMGRGGESMLGLKKINMKTLKAKRYFQA